MTKGLFQLGKLRVGLASKLVVLLVISTISLFSLFGYLNLRFQQRHAEEIILQDGDHVGDLIVRSLRYHMMRNDREALYHAINDIGAQPGMGRIRILNSSGQVNFSTDPSELHTVVSQQAATCQDCHSEGGKLHEPLLSHHARFYKDAQGQQALAVVRAVENEPGCANASCHSHSPNQRILGMVDVSLSLAPVSQQIKLQQAEVFWFTVAAVFVFSFLSMLFIWRVVASPMKQLLRGIQKVASGDVAQRLPVESQDEFGELAGSFNKMTESLLQAQDENLAWAQTLEQRVEEKTRDLETAQRALFEREKMASIGKLAATVAHEVNNPLEGILTYARLTLKKLEKTIPDAAPRAEMAENLHTIERESRRCGDLMRNLLAFARKSPSQREPNDLNELIRHGLALVRHQMELRGIGLKTELQEGLPLLRCDAGQIRQVILAILVNATEAMPGGGTLGVSTALDKRQQNVEVRIRDTGVGIPQEVLPHIFDPFFTTKENQQNTGLGLAVAHSILEQHGGSISVKSAPGQGSEFLITLPLHGSVPVEAVFAAQEKR
ncbi:MAG TPA: ATP-binding protein [Methylomirabilota bacterium]|nr:ATP-binding protein [Methylomirabilota bacterium]